MKNVFFFLFAVFGVFAPVPIRAQPIELSLETIFHSSFFTPKGIDALSSNADGLHYTLLVRESGSARLVKYRYADNIPVDTLFSSQEHDDLTGKRIASFQLSKDESRILLAVDIRSVFRHSYTGIYYVYDRTNGALTRVSEDRIQQATFSLDGTKAAFSKDNNLFYKDFKNSTTVQVTADGKAGHIINGTSDWVYEEEFSIVRMFDWSASGKFLAYVRFDESEVPLYGMDIYGDYLYPARNTFKYPKAGEKNSKVSLWIYSLEDKASRQVEFPHEEEYYIPRIKWLPRQDSLTFTVMPRPQNRLEVFTVAASGGPVSLLYEDTDRAYIRLDNDPVFLSDGSVVFVSERDGRAHLFFQDAKGILRQITRGDWQVAKLYGVDEKTSAAYFQSTAQGAENRDVCSVNLKNGRIRRLSSLTGTNSASFSKTYAYYVNVFQNADTPPLYTLNDPKDGRIINVLQDNSPLKARIDSLRLPVKRFSRLTTVGGQDLAIWTLFPTDFDSTRQYPALMFVYGGPGSQQVLNTWYSSQDLWFAYLTQQGYIVTCVDGRGTGGRGADFEKTIYRRMGELELIDQRQAAETLGRLPYIDATRIGIFGWSFGGYMASLAATRGENTWRAAVAVAPVTNWRFYDSIYTERYLSSPQLNPEGYDDNSPLAYAGDLSSRFLLVHGSADDNVHLQNTMVFSARLVDANRPFEQAIYTDKNHHISGGNTRLHLFAKITDFILSNL